MKRRYICAFIAALVLSIQIPSKAAIPSQIKPCLVGNPQRATPRQFREIATVKDGSTTYYYLHAIYRPQEIPSSQLLIKVEGNKCTVMSPFAINPFQDISQFVPPKIASALSEAKWRSILSFKGGAQFIRDMVSPSAVKSQNGEILDPISLSQTDRLALKKLRIIR
jgi:hypothetical protein